MYHGGVNMNNLVCDSVAVRLSQAVKRRKCDDDGINPQQHAPARRYIPILEHYYSYFRESQPQYWLLWA